MICSKPSLKMLALFAASSSVITNVTWIPSWLSALMRSIPTWRFERDAAFAMPMLGTKTLRRGSSAATNPGRPTSNTIAALRRSRRSPSGVRGAGFAGPLREPPRGAEAGHEQSCGLFVPAEGPSLWLGAACKAAPGRGRGGFISATSTHRRGTASAARWSA